MHTAHMRHRPEDFFPGYGIINVQCCYRKNAAQRHQEGYVGIVPRAHAATRWKGEYKTIYRLEVRHPFLRASDVCCFQSCTRKTTFCSRRNDGCGYWHTKAGMLNRLLIPDFTVSH